MNHCETCGRPIARTNWSECPGCRVKRQQETATAAQTTVQLSGRVCPDCAHRPSRDQRPNAKDGRCLKCWNKAHRPEQDATAYATTTTY
jgi:hypothetical protein